jgi:2-polyprenyl-3-methyl-5-hydroxy-6-metoxy-1,4-benzoquinol methylase
MNYTFKERTDCSFCKSKDIKILGKRLNSSQGFNPHKKFGITTTIVKCKHCGIIFSNPMPIPQNIEDHYGVPPEDYWKPEYFKIPSNYLDGLINWMNSIQKIEKGAKILDIGAGLGYGMIAFEQHGYDVFGVEPSAPFYERAIEQMHIKKEKLKFSMIENCEYESNSFDVIVFTAVLEHLYEPSEMIQKVLKWLKPNGLMFIEVPSSEWAVNKLINLVYSLTGKGYVGNLSPMHEPYHLYEFSKKSFDIHSRNNGYEIADYRYYVCETFLPKILDPLLKWYMKKTDKGMELAVWLRKKQ